MSITTQNKAKENIELAIVIINYKTANLLIDCLKSLKEEIKNDQIKIVIVDNKSDDGSPEIISNWVEKNYNDNSVLIIKSETNEGFSGGNNIGINSISAKYYLLLNSDTLVRPGAITTLLETANMYPKAGLISPRLEWSDGTPQVSCFRFISPISELISSARTGIVTRIFSRFDIPFELSNGIMKPQWTSFAAVLIKEELINSVGFLDEGFFLYYEDVDYCRMAWENGWEIINTPKARIVHLRGQSASVKKNTKTLQRLPRYLYASRSRYFYKYYGQLGLLFANLCWYIGRLISLSQLLLNEKEKNRFCKFQSIDIWTNILNPGKSWK